MFVNGDNISIKHIPSGLFSECSVRLHFIVQYFNANRSFPKNICSKGQFLFYQDMPGIDVAKILFIDRDEVHYAWKNRIAYNHGKSMSDYRFLAFQELRVLIKKYFTPISKVSERKEILIQRCDLDLKNTIGVIYRGNDKITETRLAPYELFFQKANELLEKFPNSKFLVQTDELEFRNEFCARFSNSTYFETLPPIPRNPRSVIRPPVENRIGFGIELLAAINCLAQAEHLIIGSGNVDMWSVLMRGHPNNVHQFLNDKFLC